jgi:hypothetical protein
MRVNARAYLRAGHACGDTRLAQMGERHTEAYHLGCIDRGEAQFSLIITENVFEDKM